MNRKLIIFLLMVLFAISSVSAQENGVVREIKGKVELSGAGGSWKPAQAGAFVSPGTTISTGFNSQAILDLGASRILVKALTRMTLRELAQTGQTIKTGLSLEVGRVRAEVKTASGVQHDFSVISSTSTAAVRGTVIDGDGEEWISETGDFIVRNQAGRSVTVRSGQKTVVTGTNPPSSAQEEFEGDSSVSTQTNPTADGGGGFIGAGSDSGVDYSVSDVVIELEFQE